MPIIDTHHHFWKYTEKEYGWISDSMKVIRRDFLPADLLKEIKAAGVDGAVGVKAITAGSLAGTLTLGFTSKALAASGLADAGLANGTVTVTGRGIREFDGRDVRVVKLRARFLKNGKPSSVYADIDLTDDDRRLPVRVEAGTKYGWLVGILVRADGATPAR